MAAAALSESTEDLLGLLDMNNNNNNNKEGGQEASAVVVVDPREYYANIFGSNAWELDDDNSSTTSGNSNSDNDNNDDDEYNDDDDDDDGPTLKQVVARGCKKYELGTAVMPQLLFHADVDEFDVEVDVDVQEEEEEEEQAGPTTTTSRTVMVPKYAQVVEQEFTSIVIEHHLKWAPMCTAEPGPLPNHEPIQDRLGRYDFGLVDQMVDWALERNLTVKGHVLVWSVTSPVTFLEQMTPSQVAQALKRHIVTTMAHFQGRIKMWDVVNEALAKDGTLAQNVFLRKLGPNYIAQCFHWAHQADPNAILFYNDNKVEGMGSIIDSSPNYPSKSDGLYYLLKNLLKQGVPIHGCGLQCHFNAAGVQQNRCPTPAMVQQQIHRLGLLGLQVHLSEFDVRVSQLPSTTTTTTPEEATTTTTTTTTNITNLRHVAQRQIYHDIVAAALAEPSCTGIYLWGFTDRHTWVHTFYYDDEPLILDEDYQRKPSYYGLRSALETLILTTPPTTTTGTNAGVENSNNEDDRRPWGHLWMQPEPPTKETTSTTIVLSTSGDERPDWEQPGIT